MTTRGTPDAGRPVVLRGGTVLTMDDAHTVLTGADVLVVGDRIAAVGPGLDVPEGTQEIDASRRHRDARHDRHPPAHVADRDARLRRRLDADPVLRLVLPRARQDVPARGHPRRQPALGLGGARGRRHHHGRLVARAADRRPRRGRGRRAAGGARAGSCSPTATSRPAPGSGPPTRRCSRFLERHRAGADDLLGLQLAFDVTGDPAFPEKAAFEVARELGLPVTTHAGVWGATNDDGIRLMHENGFMTPRDRLRARRDAERRLLPPDRRHRRLGLGLDGVRAERRPGLPAHLAGAAGTASRSRCRWTPACGGAATCSRAMRTTLGADRSREHLEAHAEGRHRDHTSTCAPSRSSTGRPAAAPRALGRDDLGRLEPGKKADVVLIKNDASPVSFPMLNPYGHVAFQAQRGDVHTVLVDGRVVKHEHRLVGVDLAAVRRDGRGDRRLPALDARRGGWAAGHEPRRCPATTRCSTTRTSTPTTSPTRTHGARGTMFGEPGRGLTGQPDGAGDDVAGRGSGPDFVESLARGLDVLACFDADHRTMTLTEVATAAGLARPTARRLLLTLEELGFVRSADGGFALTPKVLDARHGLRRRAGAVGHRPPAPGGAGRAAPVSRRRWPSSTARDIVYVARVSVPKIIALRVEIGTRFPAAQTSQGKVLLAALAARRARRRRSPQPSRAGLPPLHRPRPPSSCATSWPRSAPAAGRWPTRSWRPGCGRWPSPVRDGTGTVRAAMNVTVHAAETSTEHAAAGPPPAAAAHRRRRQRRVGAVAVPAAHRARGRARGPVTAADPGPTALPPRSPALPSSVRG